MTRISTATLARDVDAIVARVAEGHERIVLRKDNRNVAAIVPVEDAALLDRLLDVLEERFDNAAADKALAEPSFSWDEVKKEAGL
ncbi:MAG: prevent-host-death family protein [Candidatus Sumerlaeota bacterium]|nr:prevent-host-death family protein [Candidatus Sumerlaeota bacterium]